MTPDALRAWVVRHIVWLQGILAIALYSLIGYLLIADGVDSVPDALWLAAGAAAQAIYGFLSNSKGGQEGGTAGPVEVTTPPDEPLAVREADTGPVVPHRLGGVA